MLEGLIDELDAIVGIENEHAFNHAVEDGLLLCLSLGGRLVLPFPVVGQRALLFLKLLAQRIEVSTPPEMQGQSGGENKTCQRRPHDGRKVRSAM